MSKIRVLCDSAGDLPDDLARQLDIGIVSLNIRFGDKEFTDRVDLFPSEFWARCRASKILPETSAPSPGTFQVAYERAKTDGYDGVIVCTLSAELSATNRSAVLGAEMVKDMIDVRVIDTRSASMAEGLIAIELAELARAGATLDMLEAHAKLITEKVGVAAMIDTMEHLVKGGRVGGARALIGQVLSIKPMVTIAGGVVEEAGRQRTAAKALAALAAMAREHAPLRRFALIHGESNHLTTLEELVKDVDTQFPLIIADMGPTIGTHGGPGIIGLAWVEA